MLADVLGGHVTVETARAVYGVHIDGDEVDEPATEQTRTVLLEDRCKELHNVREEYPIRHDLPVLETWGGVLNLVRGDGGVLVQSARSGAILGPLGDNWRSVAPYRLLSRSDISPSIRVDERLEVRQYLDPLTGRSLWVDVLRTGDDEAFDFRLDALS